MKPGDLVMDVDDGDYGLVLSEGKHARGAAPGIDPWAYVDVLWPSNGGEPVKMDLKAVETGWVKVIDADR